MKKNSETHFLRYLLYCGCLEPNLQYPRGIPTEVLILWPSDEKANLLEKTMMLGKSKGKTRREWHRMRWLECITDSKDKNLSKLQDIGGQRRLACYHP